MTIKDRFENIGEYCAAGLFEECDRSLFYRKALAIRRFYENVTPPPYEGGYLYPSIQPSHSMCVSTNYMHGVFINNPVKLTEKDKDLSQILTESDFFKYRPTIPWQHTVAGCMWTHSMPAYDRIASEGLNAYAERVKKMSDADMREGLLHVIEGIIAYHKKCVEYLHSVSAREELIAALEKVPFSPAKNLYEAIVCRNFIFILDYDNIGCVATDLMPYYKGENVVPVLKELFSNMDRGETWSMALGTDYNPLTVQCLEALKGQRRPMTELFIDENCPDEVWNAAFDTMRSCAGNPAFYNYHAIIGGLKKRFHEIRDEDLKKFCGGGCTEAMLQGVCNVGSLDAGINLLLIFEETMKNSLESAESFEDFYSAYISAVSKVTDEVTKQISVSQESRSRYSPLPMRTLFVDDCIDKELEYNSGGARYMWSIINFAGTVNVIDALTVIRELIFEKKEYSSSQMLELLKNNDGEFLQKARKYPKAFGKDIPEVNSLAKRFTNDVYSLLDDKKPYLGLGFIPASIMFNSAAASGKHIGATPDGRRSGDPLAESLGAVMGKDTDGPTALLNSVTSMTLEKALGMPVLNFTVNPSIDNEIIKNLIQSYIAQGGMQMQITCVSRQMLEEAYEDPEMHRNLSVRVAGYSEYFHRLSDDLKRLVIERTIY
ncbi:MAG: hypothetical protein E7633_01660 [Ruminococcaceae bacterium]|nr:hypothetical protein [Oscillospiraceae bacterium]